MPKALLWFVVLGLLYVPRELFAEPRRSVRMEYNRPGVKGCPDEDAVRNMIGAHMTYNPFQADAAERLVIRIGKAPKGSQVEGQADLYDGGGIRKRVGEFTLDDCDLVIGSLALTIADELEPSPAPPPPAPAPPEAPPPKASPPKGSAPAAPPSNPPRVAARAPRPPASERYFRIAVAAGGSAAMGMTPSGVSGQLTAKAGLRWQHVGLWIGGQVQPSAGAEVPGARMTGARYSAELDACGHALIFYGCALAQLGAWVGTVQARVSDSGAAPWFAAGGRVGVELPVSTRFALAFFGDLVGVPQRPALRFDDERRWLGRSFAGAVGGEAIAFF